MPAHTAIAAQLEVLSIAVQEISRALAAATPAKVAAAVRERIASSAAHLGPKLRLKLGPKTRKPTSR